MNRKLFLCLLFLMFPFQLNGSSLTVPAKPRKTDNPAVFDNGLIVNEESSDSDSRFESNDVTDMLLLDAGVNAIGINATPTSGNNATLIVESTSTTAAHDAFRVNNNAGTSLFVVEEDGQVGIAKADPSVELDITGALTVSAASTHNGNMTVGDASGDVMTVNSSSWQYVNDQNISAEGGVDAVNIGQDSVFSSFSVDTTNKIAGIGILTSGMPADTNLHVHDPGSSISRLKITDSGNGTASTDGVDLYISGTTGVLLNRELGNLDVGSGNIILIRFDGSTGFTTVNDDSRASGDFIVEGDTMENLFRVDASADAVGIDIAAPAAMFTVNPPAAQTISSGNTITANACGTLKLITAAGAVTTDTTNTFTAPAIANEGCIMWVINTGANTITLDANANFKTTGGLDVVLTADDVLPVASTGSGGVWYQLSALQAN